MNDQNYKYLFEKHNNEIIKENSTNSIYNKYLFINFWNLAVGRVIEKIKTCDNKEME